MKIWHLVFLILASCSAARGRNGTAGGEDGTDTESPDVPTITPTAERETEAPTPSSSPTAPAAPFRTANTSSENGTTVGVFGSEDEDEDPTTHATTLATVAKETLGNADVTTQLPQSASSTPGFVALAFIILVIIVLCVVLYFLRKASRTYSFDLHRPSPMSRHSEPTGTFEPVYLDDLDHPGLKDVMTVEGSPPPVANGSSLPSEENVLSEETAPEEQPDSDQADGIIDPPSSANWFFDAPEEQQNENNNNPSVCSSDPFVEINLDDAWGHQLLSNDAPASSSVVPPASSSVVPFDSFSPSSSPSQFP
ncbi:uncharacterized protein LOC133420143 isoform X2 [Cololabis saira]|uniref:uncharacterized protein LOC133420143 isoform X2 n=1 Tax=Cololabis saira TaxID=129043 RepID=UPI002AD3A774|nr:uncharacterized protein LOC133420143 isoform X2 [Cololabis saira]